MLPLRAFLIIAILIANDAYCIFAISKNVNRIENQRQNERLLQEKKAKEEEEYINFGMYMDIDRYINRSITARTLLGLNVGNCNVGDKAYSCNRIQASTFFGLKGSLSHRILYAKYNDNYFATLQDDYRMKKIIHVSLSPALQKNDIEARKFVTACIFIAYDDMKIARFSYETMKQLGMRDLIRKNGEVVPLTPEIIKFQKIGM